MWTLSVLSYGEDFGEFLGVSRLGMRSVVEVLHNADTKLQQQAVFVIMNACNNNDKMWESFVQFGGVDSLLLFASSMNLEAQRKASEELYSISSVQEYRNLFLQTSNAKVSIGLLLASTGKSLYPS